MAVIFWNPKPSAMKNTDDAVRITSTKPPRDATPPTSFKTLKSKLNPTMNKRNATPICASICSKLEDRDPGPIKLRNIGPTRIPEMRYAIIGGCLITLNSVVNTAATTIIRLIETNTSCTMLFYGTRF